MWGEDIRHYQLANADELYHDIAQIDPRNQADGMEELIHSYANCCEPGENFYLPMGRNDYAICEFHLGEEVEDGITKIHYRGYSLEKEYEYVYQNTARMQEECEAILKPEYCNIEDILEEIKSRLKWAGTSNHYYYCINKSHINSDKRYFLEFWIEMDQETGTTVIEYRGTKE